MERARVIEIIEAYGGHPAAWPETERAAASLVADRDAGLTQMMAEARQIDLVLRDWARELVPVNHVEADAAALKAMYDGSEVKRRRWLPAAAMGGALAASLAVGAMWLPRPDTAAPVAPKTGEGMQIAFNGLPGEDAEAAQDMLVWGSIFTPTPEEEMVL